MLQYLHHHPMITNITSLPLTSLTTFTYTLYILIDTNSKTKNKISYWNATIPYCFNAKPCHATPLRRGQHQDLPRASHWGTGRRYAVVRVRSCIYWYAVCITCIADHTGCRQPNSQSAEPISFVVLSFIAILVIIMAGLWHVQHVDERCGHRALADGQASMQLHVSATRTHSRTHALTHSRTHALTHSHITHTHTRARTNAYTHTHTERERERDRSLDR